MIFSIYSNIVFVKIAKRNGRRENELVRFLVGNTV